MKIKQILIPLLSAIFFISFKLNVAAQGGSISYRIPNPSRYGTLEQVINAAASLIQPLFLLTFGAMLLVGAFTLLTSQGDEEKVEASKKTITAAIIGFVIAVLAPTIVNLLLNIIGVEGLESL